MPRLRNIIENLRRKKEKSEDFLLEGGPRYVAIIMDGNGRWASKRGLPAIAGHREGARNLKRIIKASRKMGVEELTVYAFSTENWRRPSEEVNALMDLFMELIEKEVRELNEQGVQVRFIGRRQGLSSTITQKMRWSEELTKDNTDGKLFIAFNYGGRAEIEDAVMAAIKNGGGEDVAAGGRVELGKYMYAPEMHDPELLIRTSGEQRTSNFLIWQCAYCELYFSDKLWPNFNEEDLFLAMKEYTRRQRRFGSR